MAETFCETPRAICTALLDLGDSCISLHFLVGSARLLRPGEQIFSEFDVDDFSRSSYAHTAEVPLAILFDGIDEILQLR